MDEKEALRLLKKYAPSENVYRIMVRHSRATQRLAMKWARKIKANGHKIDLDFVKTAALVQKAGGGTGFSFSRLRPRGDRISSSGDSSGSRPGRRRGQNR